jgi:hypothetical protein
MREKGIIITASLGVIMVGLAIYLGILFHKNHTPDITGQMQGEVCLETDGITAWDEYTISDDKTVVLERSFSFEGKPIIIGARGKWKEKTKYYKLSFKTSRADYLSEDIPLSEKGKKISPTRFLSKTVRIPKAGISPEEMNILIKREVSEGKKGWDSFKLYRNGIATKPLPSIELPTGNNLYEGNAIINEKEVPFKMYLDFSTNKGVSYYSQKGLELQISDIDRKKGTVSFNITERNPEREVIPNSVFGENISAKYQATYLQDGSITGTGKNWRGNPFTFQLHPAE